ncbi:WXG100 family type VII secretion target [Stackebrandtia soli]|uniref:WXG100 family type VII secretion target n=1 Tax=Stackebrandtia soli TaxID=1892856 RepID=UPI0039EABBE6
MAANQINKEYMESVAADFEGLAEELAGDAQALMNSLAPMEQDLVGKAGTTFTNIKNTVQENLTVINRALDDIAVGIRTTGREMDASDEQSDSSLNQAFGDGGSAASQLSAGR